MSDMEKFRNILLEENGTSINYKPVNHPGSEPRYPYRPNRPVHGQNVQNQFEVAWKSSEEEIRKTQLATAIPARNGVYLEILGKEGYDLITKSLEDSRQGIRLLNVTETSDHIIKALIYIPNKKRDFLLKKISKYKSSNAGAEVIGSIECISSAIVESFWIGNQERIPKENRDWCEIWLRYAPNETVQDVICEFESICEIENIETKKQKILFPERVVVGVRANKKNLETLLLTSSRLAEIRDMLNPTSFFTGLDASEQREWTEEMVNRIDISKNSNTSVCIIDTGVNNGHPFLKKILSDTDMHTIHPSRGTDDRQGHGTQMAGIAGFFTLEDKLASQSVVEIHHFLESVKLLDNSHDNPRELYGDRTSEAISLAEIERPTTNRAICLAVTADNETCHDGKPSSWSGALDNLTAGVSEKNKKRLILVSAGNTTVEEIINAGNVNTAIMNHSIEDPGQAWNVVTVGAYTNKDIICDKEFIGYEPVVPAGSLSPFTSTSTMWDKRWPIKPDIVLEGGNLAFSKQDNFYSESEDLALLTTGHHYLTRKPFATISMTSSATAQASWIAANIQHYYPELWPETIRALLIHSAEWTDEMINSVAHGSDKLSKSDYRNLIQMCGYGVPNLEKAIWSISNSVNMVIQDELQPYIKKTNSSVVANEMHIHTLPWPSDVLLEYGDTPVRMKVTLSYYIEPGPGEIGWKDKYRYPSCGLIFDVNNETENREQFAKRISIAIRDEEDHSSDFKNDSTRWSIGSQTRNRGSIHSDIWEGTASELSNSNMIIVYPVTGWWKVRTNLKRTNSKVRYSLIVSVETPEVNLDLYTAIQTEIKNKSVVKTEIKAFK